MVTQELPQPLTIEVQVPSTATLVLEYERPGLGTVHQLATDEHLRKLGYRHEHRMTDRTREIIRALGLDPVEGTGSSLRYFIEHVTHWDGVHDLDPWDFIDLTARLRLVGDDELSESIADLRRESFDDPRCGCPRPIRRLPCAWSGQPMGEPVSALSELIVGNWFGVRVGNGGLIRFSREPNGGTSDELLGRMEALNLAAYLAVTADPLGIEFDNILAHLRAEKDGNHARG